MFSKVDCSSGRMYFDATIKYIQKKTSTRRCHPSSPATTNVYQSRKTANISFGLFWLSCSCFPTESAIQSSSHLYSVNPAAVNHVQGSSPRVEEVSSRTMFKIQPKPIVRLCLRRFSNSICLHPIVFLSIDSWTNG